MSAAMVAMTRSRAPINTRGAGSRKWASQMDFDQKDMQRLAHRYVELTCSYYENPATAKGPTADIALANVFRMVEYYRFNAFSEDDTWLMTAITNSMNIFGEISVDTRCDIVQSSLKNIAHGKISLDAANAADHDDSHDFFKILRIALSGYK